MRNGEGAAIAQHCLVHIQHAEVFVAEAVQEVDDRGILGLCEGEARGEGDKGRE
jgi:hypothetical protein